MPRETKLIISDLLYEALDNNEETRDTRFEYSSQPAVAIVVRPCIQDENHLRCVQEP